MLAVLLVASLSGAVFAFLFNLGRQRDGIEGASGALRGASAFLEGLEGDALGVIAGGAGIGAGVAGDETSLRLLTRGVALPAPGRGTGGLDRDLQAVEYRFSASDGVLTARRWDPAGPGASGLSGEDAPSVLATGVARLRLRYFDGTRWLGSFDSMRHGGLPVAIEVAVWFGVAGEAGATGASVGTELDPRGEEAFIGFPDDLPEEDEFDPGFEAEGFGAELLPPPDRVRIVMVPDGPVASWRDRP